MNSVMYFIHDLYVEIANVEKETTGPVWTLIYYHHLLGITLGVIDIDWLMLHGICLQMRFSAI